MSDDGIKDPLFLLAVEMRGRADRIRRFLDTQDQLAAIVAGGRGSAGLSELRDDAEQLRQFADYIREASIDPKAMLAFIKGEDRPRRFTL